MEYNIFANLGVVNEFEGDLQLKAMKSLNCPDESTSPRKQNIGVSLLESIMNNSTEVENRFLRPLNTQDKLYKKPERVKFVQEVCSAEIQGKRKSKNELNHRSSQSDFHSQHTFANITNIDNRSLQSIIIEAKKEIEGTDTLTTLVARDLTPFSEGSIKVEAVPVLTNRDKTLRDSICPICGRCIEVSKSSSVKAEDVIILFNNHVDRCARRGMVGAHTQNLNDSETESEPLRYNRRKRGIAKPNVKYNNESTGGEKESNNDNINNQRSAIISPKERHKKQRSIDSTASSMEFIGNSKYDGNKDSPSSDILSKEMQFTTLTIQDDWEDVAYANRLAKYSSDGIGIEYVTTEYGTQAMKQTWETLHVYQQEGCKWLFELYEEGVGGILGDEMGKNKGKEETIFFL